MAPYLRKLAEEYERLFVSQPWVVGSGVSLFVIILAYAINSIAGQYATVRAPIGRSISDTLLDIIPKIDTSFLHLGAKGLLGVITLSILFFKPRYFPSVLAGIASIVLVRSVFINMTHLGLYQDASRIYGAGTTFGGDLFFSGHVAIPFILALVLWEMPRIRYLYITLSLILGASSILGHYHYTIDVFAAPFIAYGVYMALYRLLPAIFKI